MGAHDYTGKTLDGKYQVVRLLGEGGMGAVYLGQHITIGKAVAVKFLHSELAVREEVVKRFFREAQAAAAVRHRNIIDVMDLGISEQGEPYLVMEYLEGEGLGDRVEQSAPFDLPTTCGILEGALVGLAAAHEKGIVHRDLKPDNIFLVYQKGDAPDVKLIDFGISKIMSYSDQTKLTQDGSMLGTPAYMSPEQARGLREVDHRTDLYSVGVIMYEMLTGDLPYVGESYNELLANLLTEEPRAPSEVYQGFPEAALPVIGRALQKDPKERYQSAEEMLQAVRDLTPLGERVKHLTLFSANIKDTSTATGDLGKSHIEMGDTKLASDLLSQMIQERSGRTKEGPLAAPRRAARARWLKLLTAPLVSVWGLLTRNRILGPLLNPLSRVAGVIRRHRLLKGLSALFGVAGAVALAVALCSEPDEEGILITVRGAPKGAKIYYDDSLVPINPFRVKEGDTLVPLRVEAPKGREFKISIVPSEDQVVNVRKLTVTAKTEPQKDDAPASPAPNQPDPVKTKRARESEKEGKAKAKDKAKDDGESKKAKRRRFDWRLPWRKRKN